jgi:hypothetical protein
MNDDALLAVNRDELVEVAQQCYDAEVARRNLIEVDKEEAAADAAAEEESAIRQEMVEVATFSDVDDARMALALLKAAEIPCYLENSDPSLAGSWMGQPGFGAFRLTVPPILLDQAREVLETEISEEELAAQAEAAAEVEEEEEEPEEEEAT